jgi:hypothetical protein
MSRLLSIGTFMRDCTTPVKKRTAGQPVITSAKKKHDKGKQRTAKNPIRHFVIHMSLRIPVSQCSGKMKEENFALLL